MFFDEADGGNIIACDEMPKIHVCAVVFREGKRRLPMLGRRGGVAVIAHHELVFVGKLTEAFEFLALV